MALGVEVLLREQGSQPEQCALGLPGKPFGFYNRLTSRGQHAPAGKGVVQAFRRAVGWRGSPGEKEMKGSAEE